MYYLYGSRPGAPTRLVATFDSEEVLTCFQQAEIDLDALAAQLQSDGDEAFDKSWNDLMACIKSKSEALKDAG